MIRKIQLFLKFQIILLPVTCLVFAGCARGPAMDTKDTPTLMLTSIPITSSTPSPTFTPQPSSTMTLVPQSSPTPTNTLVPVPTLLPKEQEAYLLDLINTNGGCELPCFFGINPGESQWEDIRRMQGPIHTRDSYVPDAEGLLYMMLNINQKKFGNLELVFSGSGDTITHIVATAGIHAFNPYPSTKSSVYSPAFAQALEKYHFSSVLSQYGEPSRILVYAQGQIEPNSGTMFTTWLIYDDLGLGIKYQFENVMEQLDSGAFRVCPDFSYIYTIRLHLQSAQEKTPVEEMPGSDAPFFSKQLKPLEESTSLTIKDFYTLFINADKGVCFDVP